MSHTKIATKILEVVRQIPTEQELGKLNEVLSTQKLIHKTKYQIEASREITTVKGVVWHYVTVSCELTIIDTESGEEMTNVALGSGLELGVQAVAMAQEMAQRYAWLAALNISNESVPEATPKPEIIVETPESNLIASITAMWKWTELELTTWVTARFKGRHLEQLNLAELSVLKNELENYGR